MYGLDAINANNGWAISAVGVTIVFSGLVTLSLVISQLHRILALWEDPSKIKAMFKAKKIDEKAPAPAETELVEKVVFTENQKELAKQFDLLAQSLEDHFSLPRLLHRSQVSGLEDACLNLNSLLKAKIIVPDGAGFFTWDKDRFNSIISR